MASAPIRIMPFDSATHGWYSGVTGEMDSYRKELKNLLGDVGYTTDFAGSLPDGSFADSKATVVLALTVNVQDGHPELAADTSTYNSNLNATAQARIGNGDNLIVVDMEHGAGFDYASADMADRLHPSPQGYSKMATNWFPAVKQAILRQQDTELVAISSTNNQIKLGLDNLAGNWPVQVERTPGLTPPVVDEPHRATARQCGNQPCFPRLGNLGLFPRRFPMGAQPTGESPRSAGHPLYRKNSRS